MTNPLASAEFFALEAGESLDRLATLLGRETPPQAEELLRAVRILRGSALMAGHHQIARAAASLEAVARARREGTPEWDAITRERLGQAIEDFRLLVRRVRQWDETDTGRAMRLGQELDHLAGRTSSDAAIADREELNTGVRAFVAREGALIASSLDRAARALQAAPGDREPLYTVIRKMQSLRGLAELGELPPLPEILDGIEMAVGDLTRLFAPPPGVDEVMSTAAHALTRISRDIADRGRPDPDAEEARRFTELLLRAFAVERDVVSIESLYFTGDPEPVTPPLSQPQFAPPAPLGPVELVSHGEHLCQSADLIARARSATERDLRLYHLLGALRSVGGPGPDPVGAALGVFARSAREALAAGVAAHAAQGFASCLREAGELLRAVADADDRMVISRRILDVAYQLDGLRLAEAAAPTVALPIRHPGPMESGSEIVPIESLLYSKPETRDEQPVVPIESLAPETEPEPAPASPPPSGLERSYVTYDRLRRERSPSPPSLERLMGTEPPPVQSSDEIETVEIGILCYRGRAALERAVAVQQQLAEEIDRHGGIESSIQPLLQELLDLVPLALAEQ
ncbi:MAG TPA: Hpt domain-containing protein [Gemmatimonadales bacterium]|jgi:hypothetical protein